MNSVGLINAINLIHLERKQKNKEIRMASDRTTDKI